MAVARSDDGSSNATRRRNPRKPQDVSGPGPMPSTAPSDSASTPAAPHPTSERIPTPQPRRLLATLHRCAPPRRTIPTHQRLRVSRR